MRKEIILATVFLYDVMYKYMSGIGGFIWGYVELIELFSHIKTFLG